MIGRFDIRRPTCRLELPRDVPAPEQVTSATFDVTNVSTTRVERGRVSGVGRPPIESEVPLGMGLRRATVNLQTRVDFETGLRRMTCAYWAEVVRNQPPNLTEIRAALGDLARLE